MPPFKPGQFLTFSLDVPQRAGDGATDGATDGAAGSRTITRCYSLSERPDPGQYRVTIKRVPAPPDHPQFEPGLSSNHFHDRVQVGDVLRVKAPSGHFFIDPDAAVPAVLIAGGIGVTPMMSMLRWCLAEQPQRTVHFYYGLRNSAEHAFKAQLEALAAAHPLLRLHVVYSRPLAADVAGRDYQQRGHVDVELLRRTLPHGRHQFYVCGPPAMMGSLVPALAEWGVPLADLHYEAFGPASVRLAGAAPASASTSASASDPAAGVAVRFRRSARTVTWDGRDATLLDFAERHGIAVESGCRSGGCGSCETRVLEGSVQYERAPDHDVAAGHCLLCVGRPAEALVLEA
ncbi:MAG: 2Fe-2S iron-sulfur cluster-binding protein [Rubrivivax sp.]